MKREPKSEKERPEEEKADEKSGGSGGDHDEKKASSKGHEHRTDAQKRGGRKKLFIWSAVLLILIIGGVTTLAIIRHSGVNKDASSRAREEGSGQKIETASVTESPPERTLSLIGETRAFYSVTLYPRVSGYLDKLLVDIGDRVTKGQLLAHVESPEAEQAYLSASANAYNLRRVAERTKILFRRKLVSQQQTEQAVSAADVAEATLKTQAVLRGYQEIVAPFDGIISNRFVDPGSLLQDSSGSQAASQPLFTVTQADKLRVFAYIDQGDSPYVHPGDPVEIYVPARAGDPPLVTRVERIADELDSRTRTLLIESYLDNSQNQVVAGSFVQVRMKIKSPPLLEAPVQALVMKNDKPYVAVVGADGKLESKEIDLVKNDGENILMKSGVKKGDKVALNVGNSATNGEKVRPSGGTQQAGSAAPGPGPGESPDKAAGQMPPPSAGQNAGQTSGASTQDATQKGEARAVGSSQDKKDEGVGLSLNNAQEEAQKAQKTATAGKGGATNSGAGDPQGAPQQAGTAAPTGASDQNSGKDAKGGKDGKKDEAAENLKNDNIAKDEKGQKGPAS